MIHLLLRNQLRVVGWLEQAAKGVRGDGTSWTGHIYINSTQKDPDWIQTHNLHPSDSANHRTTVTL